MTNKVVIGILIFLVVLSGGLGYHAYTLNQQINFLSEQVVVLQTEQATRIDILSSELTTLRGEILTRFSDLKGEIDKNMIQIDTLEDEIGENLAQIDTLKEKIDGTLAKIDTLEGEIRDTTGLSQSVIDAHEVYQQVSQATVRISNGERTIGSGFIFDNEGHVLTAQHVVEDLSEIYIVLPDGRISTVTNTGSCLFSDVAVLTLDDELTVEPLKLADSASVRIGEPVAVIGNPFDLGETLTTGIVSQINRYVDIEYNSETRWVSNLIQFDAAVNFGNSGCPLVNAKGEIIGMVIARVEPDEGDGIYYAVTSNKIKRVVDSLITQGFYDYPWLGVGIVNLTPEMVQTKSLETASGVLVQGVITKSPAEAAGVEADDIIVAIDGVTIRDVAALTSYLGESKSPGETATLTLNRDNRELKLSLETGKRPS